jgi:transcriptional regulator with XRE-family HTH domain
MAQARLCPACRKTRLSRYNPQPLCAPCTRAAQATPAPAERGAPTWLWDSPPMRDALARVDLAAAVAVFRAAAGLSQHELADITGWSQSSLSLFESGHRDTLYDVRALLRFADAVDMPRGAAARGTRSDKLTRRAQRSITGNSPHCGPWEDPGQTARAGAQSPAQQCFR